MTRTGDPVSTTTPRLLRQRGRSRVWTAWVDFREVPLGTTDEMEARRRLQELVEKRARSHATTAPGKRLPVRVSTENGRFVVRYYTADGVRRKHRIPDDLLVPVTTAQEAQAYGETWYAENVLRRPVASKVDLTNLERGGPLSSNIAFEEFGRLWTSGALAERFPDHVKKKASASDDASRLRKYVYPIIGTEQVRAFEGRVGLELVEGVIAGLPPAGSTFRPSTRRQVLQAIHRLLTLAVYPAKLLVANPLPKGFMPRVPADKAKSYIYPEEDAKLMTLRELPLVYRLFFGILSREGLRVSELLGLRWGDVDLTRGVLTLDQNKTDEPRAWALQPDVAEALRRWRKLRRNQGAHTILVDRTGASIDRHAVASLLRESLKTAGVTRPQLFEASDTRIALRAHDLRASFVTVNLALGRSEAWITDRTGHRSSQMVAVYKRAARSHVELQLGPFSPLYEAIPELREPADTHE